MERASKLTQRTLTKRQLELGFNRWIFARRWASWVYWGLLCLYCLGFIVYPVVYPLMRGSIPQAVQVGSISIPPATESYYLRYVVLLGLLYFAAFAIVGLYVLPKILGRLSRWACLYAATCAVEAAGKDPMLTCLCVDKLLLALSDYARQKSVRLGTYQVSARSFMRIRPRSLSRCDVMNTIEAGHNTGRLKNELSALVQGLQSSVSDGNVAADRFLTWLNGVVGRQSIVSRAVQHERAAGDLSSEASAESIVSELQAQTSPASEPTPSQAVSETAPKSDSLSETARLMLPQVATIASAILAFAGSITVAIMKGSGG